VSRKIPRCEHVDHFASQQRLRAGDANDGDGFSQPGAPVVEAVDGGGSGAGSRRLRV
jgi:hypothetical protein